jgi:hypothetical protein
MLGYLPYALGALGMAEEMDRGWDPQNNTLRSCPPMVTRMRTLELLGQNGLVVGGGALGGIADRRLFSASHLAGLVDLECNPFDLLHVKQRAI